jgi:cell division septal protein FtsQ
VASGIFEESVQRVTLAVGEEAAAPPPPPPLPQLPHQEQEEEEQEMVEEERIVEDIVREMMRNEGSVRQRWVTYSGVGTLPVMVR